MLRVLLLVLCVSALSQLILAASNGALLGIFVFQNKTFAVVTINENSGAVTTLDSKFDQALGFIYDSASTADLVNGIYYVGLLQGQSSGYLLAINAKTGQTLAQTKSAFPYFVLGFDSKLKMIIGAALDVKTTTAHLFQINPHTLAGKLIGSFPQGLVPNDNGGSYDSLHSIMYARLSDIKTGGTYIIGMSGENGKVTSKTLESTTSIYFTSFYDEVADSLVSIAQNLSGSEQYYLAHVDPVTGAGTAIGSFSFSTPSFYPTVSAISSSLRQYFCVMNTQSTTTFNVISLDTGKQVSVVTNWQYEPVDMAYVTWST